MTHGEIYGVPPTKTRYQIVITLETDFLIDPSVVTHATLRALATKEFGINGKAHVQTTYAAVPMPAGARTALGAGLVPV